MIVELSFFLWIYIIKYVNNYYNLKSLSWIDPGLNSVLTKEDNTSISFFSFLTVSKNIKDFKDKVFLIAHVIFIFDFFTDKKW